uniref:Uncharacterized protein n=1 Tax=Catharus ustulatus TaxID=91951 RepID=A0A8C3VL19_CATUS
MLRFDKWYKISSRDSSLFFSFSGNQLHPLSVHSTCMKTYHHLGVNGKSIYYVNSMLLKSFKDLVQVACGLIF